MAGERDTLRVFISYARRDASAFAEELLAGLEVAGFEGFLDRHDIAAAEEWEARLGELIGSADTVVYVITPASVSSERCKWEIDRAAALSKRVIPVVALDAAEAETPDALKRLNYIFFTDGHSWAKALGDLAKALRVDLGWIREHTRLGEVARRWQERDKNEVLLLRGPELKTARAWLTLWRAPAPEPTELHRSFIAASETAEGAVIKRERARTRRVLMAVSAAALVFAVLAGFSTHLWWRAIASEARAVQSQISAEEKQREAESAALEALRRSARASLYEGLYWLRVSTLRLPSSAARESWIKAFDAFDGGLKNIGIFDGEEGGVSIKNLLTYGARFVGHCLGFEMPSAPQPGDAASEPSRRFFRELGLTQCAYGVRGARSMPAPG